MKIYFAGSIRGGRQDVDIYHQIIKYLGNFGTVLTEHLGDKSLSNLGEDKKDSAFIYERDMDWIRESDVVVVEATQPSLGVGYEIGSSEGKKPILCLYRPQSDRSLSAMIRGNKNLNVYDYKDIEEVKIIIKDYFAKFAKSL